jgi:hypothetical protein
MKTHLFLWGALGIGLVSGAVAMGQAVLLSWDAEPTVESARTLTGENAADPPLDRCSLMEKPDGACLEHRPHVLGLDKPRHPAK